MKRKKFVRLLYRYDAISWTLDREDTMFIMPSTDNRIGFYYRAVFSVINNLTIIKQGNLYFLIQADENLD